jgi:hypothetical protein
MYGRLDLTQAVFTSGTFGKWLNQEGSGFINGPIHWGIQNLNWPWKGGRTVEGGALTRRYIVGSVLLKGIFPWLHFSQPPGHHKVSRLLYHTLLPPWLPHYKPITMEQTNHGLKLWNHELKQIHFPLGCFSQVFVTVTKHWLTHNSQLKNDPSLPGVVVYTCNSTTQEAEAGES